MLPPDIVAVLGYAPRADVLLVRRDGSRRLWIEFEISRADPVVNHAKFATAQRKHGQIDRAALSACLWNSPLAWVRAERLARTQGTQVRAIAMRDTDCDLTSVIIVGTDSPITTLGDLKGKVVAVGAIDSPQATLIPFNYLRSEGLTPGIDFEVQRHDLLGGKHGDHIGGELDGAQALLAGTPMPPA